MRPRGRQDKRLDDTVGAFCVPPSRRSPLALDSLIDEGQLDELARRIEQDEAYEG